MVFEKTLENLRKVIEYIYCDQTLVGQMGYPRV
jgi:hypothetical protein